MPKSREVKEIQGKSECALLSGSALTSPKLPINIGNMATEIGTRIKRAREARRWTQKQLADALKVDRKTVDNWENGRTQPRSSIGAIEDVLDVRLDGEPENGPLISQSLLRAIANDENLTDEERVAVIAAIDSTLAKEREGNAPLSPRAGAERQRPAS
jgi:transcriptional regulator with XRE-family HTH domain